MQLIQNQESAQNRFQSRMAAKRPQYIFFIYNIQFVQTTLKKTIFRITQKSARTGTVAFFQRFVNSSEILDSHSSVFFDNRAKKMQPNIIELHLGRRPQKLRKNEIKLRRKNVKKHFQEAFLILKFYAVLKLMPISQFLLKSS